MENPELGETRAAIQMTRNSSHSLLMTFEVLPFKFLWRNRGLRIVDGTAVSLATGGFLRIFETTLQVAHLGL